MADDVDQRAAAPEKVVGLDRTVLCRTTTNTSTQTVASTSEPVASNDPGALEVEGIVIERELGAGGMGTVYIARREATGDRVALKTFLRASAVNLYRFKREFRALADVEHPNLIRLFELGVARDGRAFFTMELLADARPFVEWVRQGVPDAELPNMDRLVSALRQLAEGARALHALGYVHRDLKPSNVLITGAGRVVVLDFGLVSGLDEHDVGVTRDGQVVGSPAYMSPEQALGQQAGPAADSYAIGVILYECLTGAWPIEGSLYEVLARKQRSVDVLPALARVPPRLRQLCADLLRRELDSRPSAAAILDELAGPLLDAAPDDAPMPEMQAVASEPPVSITSVSHPATGGLAGAGELFIGREVELDVLRDAYARSVASQQPVVIRLRGPSGQGKSSLLRRFRLSLRDSPAMVLHGSCRERENIPLKGVDAVIDALSLHLRRLSATERARLRPRSVGALVRVFPVLDQLWPDATSQQLSPSELRGVSAAALREVVARLAGERPLVVQIDDFQWSDLDSVELLEGLLSPPRPPPLLLVLIQRDDTGDEQTRRVIETREQLGRAARTLELGPLSPQQALALALELADRRPTADTDPDRVQSAALLSGGNPFYIGQLLHNDKLRPGANLDDIVVNRLEQLGRATRALLELIAVGGPIETRLVLELCDEAGEVELAALHEQGLIGGEMWLEAAHDRIREVTLMQLPAHRRAELHTSIGRRLLADNAGAPQAEMLFRVVNHLGDGLGVLDELEPSWRLELARLHCEAGDRAIDKASLELAHAFYGRAHALLEPWHEHGPTGGELSRLCVQVRFGQSKTTRVAADEDQLLAELLRWPLPPDMLGDIVMAQLRRFSMLDQAEQMFEFGLRQLRSFGFPTPRRMSWPRVLTRLVRGHRLLRRSGLQHLSTMPPIGDPRMQVITQIIARLAGWTPFCEDPRWALWCVGVHAELLARHGRHDDALEGLYPITNWLMLMGNSAAAWSLWKRLALDGPELLLSENDRVYLNHVTHTTMCRFIPFRTNTARMLEHHRSLVELGRLREAAFVSGVVVSLHLEVDTPLLELEALVEDMCLRGRRGLSAEYDRYADAVVSLCRALIDGLEHVGLPNAEAFETPIGRATVTARCVLVHVLNRSYTAIWAKTRALAPIYDRVCVSSWPTPSFAVLALVVAAEQLDSATLPERQRLRRFMRARRAGIVAWAADCPENFAPMLALADAEIAIARGRYEHAMGAYERARTGGLSGGMNWLAALAADRQALHAARRGHGLIARAALLAARDVYVAWGARALVSRSERELANL